MTMKYLNGEDRLTLWLSDVREGWMTKLEPVEFDEDELKRIEAVLSDYDDLQQELMDRFGFNRFYV